MSTLRRTVLATAVISTGLLSSAGMAFAGNTPSGDHGTTVQEGLVNSSDLAPNTALNACGNDVPANVLGVQVPVQDNALDLPLLSSSDDDEGTDDEGDAGRGAAGVDSCSSPIHAVN